jgi:hypothetical protein
MKRYICAILVIVAISFAGTITKTFNFSESQLVYDRYNNYVIPNLPGLDHTYEVGSPCLPMAVYNVLVPATSDVVSITVEKEESIEIPGVFDVMPTPQYQKISSTTGPVINANQDVYNLTTAYPGKLVNYTTTGDKSGYRICSFSLYPVQYTPAEKKLVFYKSITIKIIYEEGKVAPTYLTPKQKDVFAKEIRSIVINPNDVESYSPSEHTLQNEVRYLLITTDAFVSSFQPLVDWRTQQGLKGEILTVSTISSTYPGRDVPEKIRNAIISYYQNRGLIFVVLGGDDGYVPKRGVYVSYSGYTETSMPCDLYFADLTGSWDGDHDNTFGETNDSIDFYPDIYVGRASVSNTTQATTFVNKVLTFEKNPPADYLKRILLPSVMLFSSYNWHGHIVNDSIAARTPWDWTDRSIIDPASQTPMRDSLNNGFEFCHVPAHGNETGFYNQSGTQIYGNSVASSQTNGNRLFVLNSIACLTGSFDYSGGDCLAEAVMHNPNGGAVATIQNSRDGWGAPPILGPSERMDVDFYDFLFNRDTFLIGAAHARSKSMHTSQALSDGCWRWCIYELNLFGDPAMPLWTDTPQNLTAQFPQVVPIGPFNLNVTVSRNTTPVNNALVSISKGTEIYEQGYTNTSGLATIPISATTPGKFFITVTAHNGYPYQDSAMVQSNGAYVSFLRASLVDSARGNGDSVPNPGEGINMRTWVKNWGNAVASNVIGKLRLSEPSATISDSVKSFGSIASNDSAYTGNNGFDFTIAPSCTNNQRINFQLYCKDALDSTWQSNITLTVLQCVLQRVSTVVNDPAPGGNNNGIINRGETVNLIATIRNTGGATADNVTTVLSSTTAGINILDANGGFGSIAPNNTGNNTTDPYTISVDSSIVPGTMGQFRIVASCGYYTDTFYFTIPIEIYLVDLENNNGSYVADPPTSAWEWGVPTSGPNSAYSGTKVWATVLAGNYANSANWKLTSEVLTATSDNPQLRFWHWYQMEMSGSYPGRAYDGGNVKISTNNGSTWTLIRPVGGYNGLGYTSTSGIANESCYTGGQNAWTEATFDLPVMTGQQFLLRWHFGSDAAVQQAGWYIDDITGLGFTNILTGISEGSQSINNLTTMLYAPKPNPVINGLARISFSLAEPTKVSLQIYDASGRIVKTLVNSQLTRGIYNLTWDGKDKTGNNVAQGIYFCQLKADNTAIVRKLAIIK